MPRKPPPSRRARKPRGATKPRRLSRQHAPEDMALPDWQIGLRRQFGREQNFKLEKLDDQPVFSDWHLDNPQSGRRYRVSIRGVEPGSNRCTCGDYLTNELGTCKHIEFVLATIERKRGVKRLLREGAAFEASELWLAGGSQRCVRLRPGTAMPSSLLEAARQVFDATDHWNLPDTHFDRLPAFIDKTTQAGHALVIDGAVRFLLDDLADAAVRRERLAARYPRGADEPSLRNLLAEPLLPYQAEGALFAARAGRALIADEMGLGKTVQAIAAAELWRRHCEGARWLVVCPTSLKAQWAQELRRFAGHEALIIEGDPVQRSRQYAAPATCKIASYDSLVRDLDIANAWRPDVLIVDEAQRIKNWETRAARALKRLDSRFAVILTGTPLENKLEELLSVVQLVDRHRLGATWRFLHEHQLRDESGRVIGYRHLDRIGETLAPILVRRRKAEVLPQLPARQDHALRVPLTPLQRALHDEQADLVARIVQRWRRQRVLSEADQKRLQAALQKMRMACNSSYLLDRKTDEGNKIPELMAWLQPRLAEVDVKVVIFSAWIATHELIAARLDELGIGHVLFNGLVPARERARRVESFRHDPERRVFLATDTGGVGLNLQHTAALIVNVDLPWNPAVLEQRIGRVWRLGQARKVDVLNLIASDSIEQNMLGVLQFKRSLFAGVLEGGAADIRLEGTRLSRFMHSVESLTSAESAAAVTPVAPTAAATVAAADGAATPVAATIAGNALAASAAVAAPETAPSGAGTASPTAANADAAASAALQPLLSFAAQWLGQLVGALGNGDAHPQIERDAVSGRASLRLPLPDPEQLRSLAAALEAAQRTPD